MKELPGGRGFRPKHNGAADPLGANSEIARKLKDYFNDLVTPDVPDRFTNLLSRLEQAEKSEPSADKKD